MSDLGSVREKLAALEHEQWMQWAKTLMEKENLSPERVARWRLLCVPYESLTEKDKDSDREWADKVLRVVPSKGRDRESATQLQDLFIERLRERWARGARKYGDGSFARPLGSTRDELLAEVEDLAGWAFVLWVQLRQRLDRVLERAPAPARDVKGCCE